MINDYSGHRWVSGFNEAGEILFGITAEQLNDIKTQNLEEFDKVMNSACFKTYSIKLKVKEEDNPKTGEKNR